MEGAGGPRAVTAAVDDDGRRQHSAGVRAGLAPQPQQAGAFEQHKTVVGAGGGGIGLVQLAPRVGGGVEQPSVAQVLDAVEAAVNDDSPGHNGRGMVLPSVRFVSQHAVQREVGPLQGLQLQHRAPAPPPAIERAASASSPAHLQAILAALQSLRLQGNA